MAAPDGKKPGLMIEIGVGKPKPGDDVPPASGGGKAPAKKGNPFAKSSGKKPGAADKANAIAKRLAALNNKGPIPPPNNDNAGNASGGFPGM